MLVYTGKVKNFEAPEEFHPQAKINSLISLDNGLIVGFKKQPTIEISRGKEILFTGNFNINQDKIKYVLCWSGPISIASEESMNEVELSGYVGTDPEEKMFKDGGTVHQFPLVVKNGRSNVWMNISLFNKGNVAQYIEKGKLISLKGYIKPKTSNGKTYINVIGNSIDLLGGQASKKPQVESAPF